MLYNALIHSNLNNFIARPKFLYKNDLVIKNIYYYLSEDWHCNGLWHRHRKRSINSDRIWPIHWNRYVLWYWYCEGSIYSDTDGYLQCRSPTTITTIDNIWIHIVNVLNSIITLIGTGICLSMGTAYGWGIGTPMCLVIVVW